MDALGRITGVVNELGSCTSSTEAQKRAAADGTVLVNYYGSGEKHGTDSLVYLSDHLGSARAWYRVSDGEVGTAEYGAYGQRQLLAAGPGEPDRGCTGHLRHAASGLVLAPYRAYDPQLGRWLSEDPIMEAGGLNLYGYVSNNPINLWDPLGLLVDGTFSMSTGTVTLIDRETGDKIIAQAFSGNLHANDPSYANAAGKDTGPLPIGSYDILNHPSGLVHGNTWYDLDSYPKDKIRDDYDPSSKRGKFRLHKGTASNGCVTVKDDKGANADQWNKIMDMLKKTKTTIVKDAFGRNRTYFGNMKVTK